MIEPSLDAPRVARWSGIIGVVLPASTLVAYPIWAFPGTPTPSVDVARWAAAHHDRLVLTMLGNTVGVLFWFVFGAAVWSYLRDRLPVRSILPTCFAAAFTGSLTLLLAGFAMFDLLLYRRRSADVAALLYDLTFGLVAMSGVLAVVALLAFAVAVQTRRALPIYTGYLALAAAVAHPLLLVGFVVRTGPLSLEGLLSTVMPLLLLVWMLGTALAMPPAGDGPVGPGPAGRRVSGAPKDQSGRPLRRAAAEPPPAEG
ncbi:hypothetical protein [Mycolicibacter minnesotensis]